MYIVFQNSHIYFKQQSSLSSNTRRVGRIQLFKTVMETQDVFEHFHNYNTSQVCITFRNFSQPAKCLDEAM